MKNIIIILSIFSLAIILAFTNKVNKTEMSKNIYDFTINSIDGETINLKDFVGKKILFVNVASECGYTPQYEDLESLYKLHKYNLVVIGFPCNQFGSQEPGNNEEIKSFCQKNYGVTFLITEKIEVKGENQHPIYKWLTNKEFNGVESSKIKWNFQKYLVDEAGKYLEMYPSAVKPLDEKITSKL